VVAEASSVHSLPAGPSSSCSNAPPPPSHYDHHLVALVATPKSLEARGLSTPRAVGNTPNCRVTRVSQRKMSRSKTTTTLLVAALALACLAVDARAQSIGSIIGDTVDYFVDGVDARTFFNPSAGRCRNRPAQTPRNLQARATNPTTVQLTWRANGNSCVDFYEVTVSGRRG